MKPLFPLILLASTLIFSACHKVETTSPVETPISRATYFIDTGDYDTAINMLEDLLKNADHSDDPNVRIVLASAYAGRAGVKVENYWDYLIGFDAFSKDRTPETVSELVPMNLIPAETDEKIKEVLRLWNAQYNDLQRLQAKAEKIPVVSQDQRKGLMRARSLLSEVKTPTAKLYRSLLSAVVIKSAFLEGDKIIKTWSEYNYSLCLPTANRVSEWLSKVLTLLSEGLDDLGQAYPDQNSDYQSVRTEIEKGMTVSKTLNTTKSKTDPVCALKN